MKLTLLGALGRTTLQLTSSLPAQTHGSHEGPPQSLSSSVPFLTPSRHDLSTHRPAKLHPPSAQSASVEHSRRKDSGGQPAAAVKRSDARGMRHRASRSSMSTVMTCPPESIKSAKEPRS